MIKVRRYKKADEEEVKKLISKVLGEIFKNKVNQKWENFQDYLVFYVAEDTKNKKLIGTAGLLKINNNKLRLRRFYIKKEYRRKGMGRKLYNLVENFCRKNKIKELELSTYPQMDEAIAFYEKNEFKQIREEIDKDGNKKLVFLKHLKLK